MLNLGSIFAGMGFVLAVIWGIWNFEGLPHPDTSGQLHRHPREVSFQHDGIFGTFDRAQLQRGFQVYKEVCSACHSLNFVAFRNMSDLGFSEAEIKALAKGYDIPSLDDKGEPTTRKGLPADQFPSPFPNTQAAAAANNGKAPPDLSLIVSARHDGPAYVYSLLTGYGMPVPKHYKSWVTDPKTHQTVVQQEKFEVPEGLYYNPYFSSLTIGMPPPLQDGQVTYSDGTKASVDQMSKDVVAFLSWAAEPRLEARKRTGVEVLAFLAVLIGLSYASYRRIWAHVKH